MKLIYLVIALSLEATWEKGDSLMSVGKYKESLKYASYVAEEAKKQNDTEMLLNAYSTMMIDYQFTGEFDKSEKYGKLCLEYDRKAGDSATISTDLNNLAAMYCSMKQPETALTYAMEAMLIEKTLDPRGSMLARRYGRLAEIYHALGNYEEGLIYAKMALAIDENNKDTLRMAFRKCQMADNLRELDKIAEAKKLYKESIPYFIKEDVSHSLAVTYYDLAQIEGQEGNEETSKDYLSKAFQIVRETGDNLIVQRIYDELMDEANVKHEKMMLYRRLTISLIVGFIVIFVGIVIIIMLRKKLRRKTKALKAITESAPQTDNNVQLSECEIDIIRLSCEGLQYKEIAERLDIAYKTVDTIKSRLFKKLNINNTTELVIYAIKNSIVKI